MSQRRRLASAALLLAAAAGCSDGAPGRSTAGSDSSPNVLLIVIDTLRPDRLGAWGHDRETSPAIDAFAEDAIRFERAYTTAPWTKPALASIFTGRYPSSHGVTAIRSVLPEAVPTLAEILGEAGYRTASVTSNGLLRAGSGFERGFEVYDDSEAQGHDHLSTPGVTDRALELLDEYAAGDDPFFLSLLYFDPHFEYVPHAAYDFAAESVGRLDGSQTIHELRGMQPPLDAAEADFLRDVYDEEIRYTDEGLARLFARLEELGIADDTLVVLTADHGEEFMEHGWVGHTRIVYEGVMRVPLAIRPPRAADWSRRVVEQPVSLIDLAPTVLDCVGLAAPNAGLQGRSLRGRWEPGAAAGDAPVAYFEVDYVPLGKFDEENRAKLRSVVAGDVKLIRNDVNRRFELYDLAADPLETTDLSRERPELLEDMRALLKLRTGLARSGEPVQAEEREVGAEERALLERLGYLDD